MRFDPKTRQSPFAQKTPAAVSKSAPPAAPAKSLTQSFLEQARALKPNSRFTIYTAFANPTERAQAVRAAEKAAAAVNAELPGVTTAIKVTAEGEVALSVISSRDPETVRLLKSGVGDF